MTKRTEFTHVPLLLCALLAASLLAPAFADVIVSGRRLLEGEIVSEDDDVIVLRMASGELEKVRKNRVDEVVRGKDIEGFLKDRAAASAEDAEALSALAALARSSRKTDVAQELYRKVLALDPTNKVAGRSLRWPMIEGKFVDPEGLDAAAATGKGEAAEPGNKMPRVAFTVVEQIDGIKWTDWLLRHPDPDYNQPVGEQLAGNLFHHDHEWNLFGEKDGKALQQSAQYDAAVTLNAKKGKTTDFFGAHDLQHFYDAEVTLEVTRRCDGARVLWCKSTLSYGNTSETEAVKSSFLKACIAIIKSPVVAASPLWDDPAKAPAQTEIIVIKDKGKKKTD